jgi:hypothetical protein
MYTYGSKLRQSLHSAITSGWKIYFYKLNNDNESSPYVDGRVVPVLNYAMKTYGGSGHIDPRFLDVDTSWR